MQPGTLKIIQAGNKAQFDAAKQLFIEYQQFLGVDLCFQSFDAELLQLETMYTAPEGALLLATVEGNYAGCVAIRYKSELTCEMKRLYVKDGYQKHGIGKKLVLEIMQCAGRLGYKKIILDTLERLQPALKLYSSLGFTTTGAYYQNPLTGVIYLQKEL